MTDSRTVETSLQQQQCELDLNQFVDLLIYAAHAAWGDPKDARTARERHLYLRQGDILATAVAELKGILHHRDLAVRAKRMRTLHEALGAAAVIARAGLEDPVADKVYDHEVMAHARQKRSAKSRCHAG